MFKIQNQIDERTLRLPLHKQGQTEDLILALSAADDDRAGLHENAADLEHAAAVLRALAAWPDDFALSIVRGDGMRILAPENVLARMAEDRVIDSCFTEDLPQDK
jgi:hypothetical protein